MFYGGSIPPAVASLILQVKSIILKETDYEK